MLIKQNTCKFIDDFDRLENVLFPPNKNSTIPLKYLIPVGMGSRKEGNILAGYRNSHEVVNVNASANLHPFPHPLCLIFTFKLERGGRVKSSGDSGTRKLATAMTFLSAVGNRWYFLMNRRPACLLSSQTVARFLLYLRHSPFTRARVTVEHTYVHTCVCVRVTTGRTCYLLVKGRNAARRFTRDLR